MLKSTIEKLNRKLLFKFISRFSRNTSEDELRSFLQKLHPVTTTKPLIRIGGKGDGGYLLPDDLEGLTRCFSPGVALTSSFELDLAASGIPSSLADYSVDYSTSENNLLKFDKKFIGIENNRKFMTLTDWVDRDAPGESENLLLQMDIEKYEYPVVLDTSKEVLRKFRIMVIEFHALDVIFKKKAFEYVRSVFEKILEDFYIVHIHPNNCCKATAKDDFLIPPVMEFTFYRKNRSELTGHATTFPHPLDRKNVENLPDAPLPKSWYQSS